jgi:hypothetical protein
MITKLKKITLIFIINKIHKMKKIFIILLFALSFISAKGQAVLTKESEKKVMLATDSVNKIIKTTESKGVNKSLLNPELNNPSNSNQLLFVQCSGFINKGVRCKTKVSNKTGRCFQHK